MFFQTKLTEAFQLSNYSGVMIMWLFHDATEQLLSEVQF